MFALVLLLFAYFTPCTGKGSFYGESTQNNVEGEKTIDFKKKKEKIVHSSILWSLYNVINYAIQ